MEINNKEELLEFIRKESLKLLEQGAFSSIAPTPDSTLANPTSDTEAIEDRMEDLDAGFIDVNLKRLEKLDREEESALEKEEYIELQKIKKDKFVVLAKLIASYQKKIEYLSQVKEALGKELGDLNTQGSGVFHNKKMNELVLDDKVPMGTTFRINTVSAEFDLKKVSETSYQVIKSNVAGVEGGDVVSFNPAYLKVGYQAKMKVFKNIGGQWKPIKQAVLNNITQITKNPK